MGSDRRTWRPFRIVTDAPRCSNAVWTIDSYRNPTKKANVNKQASKERVTAGQESNQSPIVQSTDGSSRSATCWAHSTRGENANCRLSVVNMAASIN